MKDVMHRDRIGPSKGQNCFWQKLSKVCASTIGHSYSISQFLTISEIVPHYRFRHQLTRSREVSIII